MSASRLKGFTLIELMVTIAIVAILAAIAFPSFQSSLRSNRIATANNEMLASISLARSEAIRSTHASILCASADGVNCGDDWNAGWLVSTDTDGNGDYDNVVRYIQSRPQIAVAVAGGGAAVDAGEIAFDNRGRPNNDGVERTITLQPSDCPAGQELLRVMTLRSVGQVSSKKQACP